MANPNAPTKFGRTGFDEDRSGPKCRAIIAPAKGGWSEPALFEWELEAEVLVADLCAPALHLRPQPRRAQQKAGLREAQRQWGVRRHGDDR
jgi:hypothetical protein